MGREVKCACGALIRDEEGRLVTEAGAFLTVDGRVVACGDCDDFRIEYRLPPLPDVNHPDYEPPREVWRRRK